MSSAGGVITVVTGAAGLLGAQICLELAGQGAQVIAVDAAAAVIEGVQMVHADVSDARSIAAVAASIAADHGRVDRLVHAAALTGRTPGGGVSGELAGFDIGVWRALIDVNLTGALICVQQFLGLLRRSRAPRVLLLGSIQGLVPTLGTGAYGVSKAALIALTRQLAAELAGDAITVNMIAPGPIIAGAAGDRSLSDDHPTPLGRYGSPQEVARAVADVLGESFQFMTGAVIPVDGGEHLRPRRGPVQVEDPHTSSDRS